MAEAKASTTPPVAGASSASPTYVRRPDPEGLGGGGEPPVRRILTIDGGGIRGVFPAAFLAELEKDLKYPIARYFDLIAGTSTGGIIAIGLALGVTAAELKALYEEKGPAIFGQARSGLRGLLAKVRFLGRWLWRPKYDAEELHSAVKGAFGKRRLGDAMTRLVIPAWHSQTQRAYLFKTAHHERFQTDYQVPAVDVAMATASAPSYFREHRTVAGVGLIDGGLWANNPAAVAVVEAMGLLGWSASQLKVLSIGCLEDVGSAQEEYGIVRLGQQLHRFFLRSQSEGSLGIARILTGHTDSRPTVYRISQVASARLLALDNTRNVRQLVDRGVTEARQQKPHIKSEFFSTPTEEFVPHHGR